MENKKRSSFSGRLGYVMAVAGSAVGLGNIWRFPYLAAKYGGGSFLITYFILAVTFGFALLITESALGRKTGKSVVSAFTTLGAKKSKWGGVLNAIIPLLIVPYYSVVGGWVCKYLYMFCTGQADMLYADSYFGAFSASSIEPIFWLMVFSIMVFAVVIFGVQKGIERVSKVLMPMLVAVAIFIAVYSLFTPGAMEGVKYYLVPSASRFSLMTIVAAMGQMFYSLSIGMGILYTYGSYMKKDIDMEVSITQVEVVDSLVAFLAGLMIIPAVFAFSHGDPSTLNAGPSLMFITMPKVFSTMAFGTVIGAFFFLLVLFAALTSAISLMECGVSVLQDEWKWSRKKSCIAIFLLIALLGIPCSLGFGVLSFIRPLSMDLFSFFDFMTNSIMMPIAAIMTCFLVWKVCGIQTVVDEVETSSAFKRKKVYVVCMKYIVIPGLVIILLSSIASAFGIIQM